MLAENPKKRKRTPAKDSAASALTQEKTVVPDVRRRAWKLPRLDESPYKEVWIKIVSLTLADLQGYKGCCRKMKYFKAVHRELLGATKILSIRNCYCLPLQIQRRNGNKYPGIAIYCVRGRDTFTGFDLRWISDEEISNVEKLVWINKQTGSYSEITHLSRNEPCDIIRFIRLPDWEAFICDYIHGRTENDIQSWTYTPNEYNKIGSSTLRYLIQMAPKWLDRSNARSLVCELISQNPCMDQDPVEAEAEEEEETYPCPPWPWNGN